MAIDSHSSELYHFYNPGWDIVTNRATEDFLRDIALHLEAGYGFVPFIGAGLSAPSGAPLIRELKLYLQRCIGLALGTIDLERRPWIPRTDQWPPFSDRLGTFNLAAAVYPAQDWFEHVRHVIQKKKDEHRITDIHIYEEALGAMAEWRSSLQYLSRLVRETRGSGRQCEYLLALDAPKQEVVDACIREVLRGIQPTLGHRMLASLGGLMRLDILLTTNFDDLLERAFAAAHNPLTAFPLPLGSNLPPWSALSNQRSIVKLHGTHYSLRADYTLDALPDETDRWRFLEYLSTSEGRNSIQTKFDQGDHNISARCQNHLLVMGCSAGERRTRAFIEHAWSHLSHDFRVYWICHTSEDVIQVQTFTSQFYQRMVDNAQWRRTNCPAKWWQGSRILQHTELGLLFLHLFQYIRRGLPPTGIIFPSVSRLAVPPLQAHSTDAPGQKSSAGSGSDGSGEDPSDNGGVPPKITQAEWVRKIYNRIVDVRRLAGTQHKLVVLASKTKVRGITSMCASVFEQMRRDNICLWIDMNDISSTDDLFEKLLDAAYYRLGIENWTPVYVGSTPTHRAAEIHRLVRMVRVPWLLFLNARETPAANYLEPSQVIDPKHPNGWLDSWAPTTLRTAPDESSDCAEAFFELLTELCGPDSPPLTVVLMCRQCDEGNSPLTGFLRTQSLVDDIEEPKDSSVKFNEKNTTVNVIKWTDGDPSKRRFLHALVLMQRTRFLATVWSDVVVSSDTPVDSACVLEWLASLEDCGLIRRKPGGFIWMHARSRSLLRSYLAATRQLRSVPGLESRLVDGWNPEGAEPEIHAALAIFYRRILAASDAPVAVFESVYHACRAAVTGLKQNTKEWLCRGGDHIEAAASLLHSHLFLIQTHGYSRGSCRRLEYVRDTLCRDIDTTLSDLNAAKLGMNDTALGEHVAMLRSHTNMVRVRSTEVMRAVAREVGEDRRAFGRQREVRALLAGETASHEADVSKESLKDCLFGASRDGAFASTADGLDPSESPGTAGAPQQHGSRHIDGPVEWIRWWRWNGMLGIQSRSYKKARGALTRGLLSTTSPASAMAIHDEYSDQQVLDAVNETIDLSESNSLNVFGQRTRDAQQLRIELLRVLEQFLVVRLQQASLVRRQLPFTDAQLRHSLGFSSETAYATLRSIAIRADTLCEHVLAHDHSSDARYTAPAMWCKSRLLMHQSICAVYLAQVSPARAPGLWEDAMKLLADAETCLSSSDKRRQTADRAIIELYRAEVRLRQALTVEIMNHPDHPTEPPLTFEQFIAQFNPKDYPTRLWVDSGTQLRDKWFSQLDVQLTNRRTPRDPNADAATPADCLRLAKACVQDAMRFLTRAEPVLLGRRRNVWWTTWFFERKLTAVSLAVWATLPETGTPIPYLGIEATASNASSIADVLLQEGKRMSRVDAYRLATIVDKYADCMTALNFRLIVDTGAMRLADRQSAMRSNLLDALSRLQEVIVARDKSPVDVSRTRKSDEVARRLGDLNTDATMDNDVRRMVDGVSMRCTNLTGTLLTPLRYAHRAADCD